MSTASEKNIEDIPIGFGLSLAMNEGAMKSFSQMAEKEQESWLARAAQAKSKAEMERLIDQMSEAFLQ